MFSIKCDNYIKNNEKGSLVTINNRSLFFPNISKDKLEQGIYEYFYNNIDINMSLGFLSEIQKDFIKTGLTPSDWTEIHFQ
jgi:hypothetical protein